MISGIYQITNKVNSKKYIGSSVDIVRRWGQHKRCLTGNYHKNSHLQNSWNKYGKDNFKFEILMLCDELLLHTCEQYFLDNWEPEYNINMKAGGGDYWSGKHRSEEYKIKMSKANSGENNPMYGKYHSKESKQKIGTAHKGKEGFWKGKTFSKEHRKNLSEVHRGKILSEEHRRKISKSSKGRTHTKETKKKISKINSGENSSLSKLTKKKVLEIRKKYKPYKYTQKMLANEYGVSTITIWRIINKKNWRYI